MKYAIHDARGQRISEPSDDRRAVRIQAKALVLADQRVSIFLYDNDNQFVGYSSQDTAVVTQAAKRAQARGVVYVVDKNGKVVSTKCYGTFRREIGGKPYTFHVTDALERLGKIVTEARTGLKACDVAVTSVDLAAFTNAATDADRARIALDAKIARAGEARVSRVIDAAPTIGTKTPAASAASPQE
jgi:hypothetical protein